MHLVDVSNDELLDFLDRSGRLVFLEKLLNLFERLQTERKSSLLTTYWSESTLSSPADTRVPGVPAAGRGSLTSIFLSNLGVQG